MQKNRNFWEKIKNFRISLIAESTPHFTQKCRFSNFWNLKNFSIFLKNHGYCTFFLSPAPFSPHSFSSHFLSLSLPKFAQFFLPKPFHFIVWTPICRWFLAEANVNKFVPKECVSLFVYQLSVFGRNNFMRRDKSSHFWRSMVFEKILKEI